ncbi:hypothetical protein [Klebsiella aerogenes]|uniref:hypothetical protein n=1 Tax=Klebsiella aerogenes TaxID=548 RepID=UPI0035291632
MRRSTRTIAVDRHHRITADIAQRNIVTQRITGAIPADQQRRNINLVSLGDREIAPDIAAVTTGVVIRQQVVNQRIGTHSHAEGIIVSGTVNAIVIYAASNLRMQIDGQIRRRTTAITTNKRVSKRLLSRNGISIDTAIQLIGITSLPINGQRSIFTIQHRFPVSRAGSCVVGQGSISMECPMRHDTQIVFPRYREPAMQ